MNFRHAIFKLKDWVVGSPVTMNLKEIEKVNSFKEKQFVTKFQNKCIDNLLSSTLKDVPFYQNLKEKELASFPVVDKLIIKNNLDQFISIKYDRTKLIRMVTSGSTGTPFVSYQDNMKKIRNTADTLFFGSLAGYKPGESLFYLKIWSDNNRKSKLLQYLQNIIPIDVIQLSNKNIDKFVHSMNSKVGRIHILGYSSALEEVCKYFDSQSISPLKETVKVGSIITMSEGLANETKERLYQYFQCKPCSRYSSIENGIVAQQTLSENKLFKVNSASYKVEILEIDYDRPAKPGKLGRIVVTDLFNYAMPFIRYDTGDIGRFKVDNLGEIDDAYLVEIQGRKLDLLLDTKGNIVSSYIMYKNMFKYPEIDQYQLVQESSNHYRFIISMEGKFDKEEVLKGEFKEHLGSDARFDIEYVNEIPLLDSGKRRKIVNNYLRTTSTL